MSKLIEDLFNSMSIVNESYIKDLKFDRTITATIETVETNGTYTVTYESQKLVAYPQNGATYKENDIVYIQVPNGDFSSQLFIVGKKLSDANEYTPVNLPFDTFIDVSGNQINFTVPADGSIGIIAAQTGSGTTPKSGKQLENTEYTNLGSKRLIYTKDYSTSPWTGYTRCGIKVNFSTLFSNRWDNTKSKKYGDYGLFIEFKTTNDQISTFSLSTNNMYGNYYNYNNYEIEYVVELDDDISINGVNIYLCQSGFSDYMLEPIDTTEPDITVNNLEMYFGYDSSSAVGNTLYLYAPEGKAFDFAATGKPVYIRWVQDGEDKSTELEANNNVFLYEYHPGTYSDGYGKSNWKKDENFTGSGYNITPYSATLTTTKYKAVLVVDGIVITSNELEFNNLNSSVTIDVWTMIPSRLSTVNQVQLQVYKNDQIPETTTNYSYKWSYRGLSDCSQTDLGTTSNSKYILPTTVAGDIEAMCSVYLGTDILANLTTTVTDPASDFADSDLHIVINDNSNGDYYLYNKKNRIISENAATLGRSLSYSVSGAHESSIVKSAVWTLPIQNTMLNFTAASITADTISYTIKSTLVNSYNQNRITLTITFNDNSTLSQEFIFHFGQAGTNGSEFTCVIKPVSSYNAYLEANSNSYTRLMSYIYNTTGEEITPVSISRTWEIIEGADYFGLSSTTTGTLSKSLNYDRPYVRWQSETADFLNRIGIIKLTYTITSETPNKVLYAYYPICITASPTAYNYTVAPEQVSYESSGYNPIYYTDEIKLYNSSNQSYTNSYTLEDNTILWNLIGTTSTIPAYLLNHKLYPDQSYNNKNDGYYALQALNNVKITTTNVTNFNPKLFFETFGKYIKFDLKQHIFTFSYYKPSSTDYWRITELTGTKTYQKYNMTNAGITPIDSSDVIITISSTTPIWLQPIITTIDAYPSDIINSWDGSSIITEDGTILSNMIGAGSKSNNAFSGVILGDWSGDSEELDQIGLMGFDKGQMSYAFWDDGTAFIGKSGSARIEFDGDKSQITSNNYQENNKGLLLDLNDGVIDAINSGYKLHIDVSDDNIESTNYPLYIGTNSTKNFKVDWTGKLYATGGEFSGNIASSSITSSTISIGGTTEKPNFIVDTSGNVTMNGNLTLSSKGAIGYDNLNSSLQTKIDDAGSGSATEGSTPPSNPKENDTWFCTADNGNYKENCWYVYTSFSGWKFLQAGFIQSSKITSTTIESPKISGNDIEVLGGTFNVKDGMGSTTYGYMGKGTGNDGSSTTTGVVMSYSDPTGLGAGNYYVICTGSGVRLQAGSTSIYLADGSIKKVVNGTTSDIGMAVFG